MLDLVPVNSEVVTSQAPKPGISPQQVAAPYANFADALNKVAGGVDDVAVRAAHDQAQTAVTRDEQGNLQLAPTPLLVGRAADEYTRVAHQSYLSQLDPEIQTKITEARVKFEGKPGDFMGWGKNYIDTLRASQPTEELQNAVGTLATRHVTESYDGLLVRQGQRVVTAAQNSLAASQSQIENELGALSLQGVTSQDKTAAGESFRSRLEDWKGLNASRLANPVFNYTPDQALYDQTQFLGKLESNAAISTVKTVYNDKTFTEKTDPETGKKISVPNGGLDSAMETARKNILENSKLNLTDDERWGRYHKAVAEIRSLESERRQDLREAKRAASEATMAAAKGVDIGPDMQKQIEGDLEKNGGVADKANFAAAMIRSRQLSSFNVLPTAEMPGVISFFARGAGAGASPEVQKGIKSAAAEAGVSPEFLFRVAGQENRRFDPNAKADGSTAAGLFQFTDATWADQLARNGAKYGLSPDTPKSDVRASSLMAAELAKENGTALKAAGIPVSEATMYVAHFAGAEGARKLYFADRNTPAANVLPDAAAAPGNRSVFYDQAGQPRTVDAALNRLYDGFGGPEGKVVAGVGADPKLIAGMQQGARKRARDDWAGMEKDFDRNVRPADGAILPIINLAKIAGDHELLETIADRVGRADSVKNAGLQPLQFQDAQITELRRQADAGQLGAGNAALLKDLVNRQQQITTGLTDNPIATTVSNFGSRFSTPAPLDVSNSDNFRAGLQTRGVIASYAKERWQERAPLSALDEADVRSVKGALAAATPEVKARIFADMTAALPYPERMATFAKIGSDAPEGMLDAFAGGLYGHAREVSTGILMGQQAMKADPRFVPVNTDKSTFNSKFDEALPVTTFGVDARTSEIGTLATIRNAARALYAFKSAQLGDTSGNISEQRVKEVVQAVTGGVLDHNGGKLVAPARGMTQRQFDGVMAGITDADLAGVTTLQGNAVTADYLRRNAQLETVADGRYLVRLGSDPARPIYAFKSVDTEMPRPFEIDLRGRPSLPVSLWPKIEAAPYPRG